LVEQENGAHQQGRQHQHNYPLAFSHGALRLLGGGILRLPDGRRRDGRRRHLAHGTTKSVWALVCARLHC
jgi:hypothetical protein